jgi:hypothetical protein
MVSIVDLRNVDVLRWQEAKSKDGQRPDHSDQRMSNAEQHQRELSVPLEGSVKPAA